VTKVGGAYLVAHGADTMGTSMAELVSGEHQEMKLPRLSGDCDVALLPFF
jgi:hypothetical protein